jgi:hypothetical protein
MRPPEPQGSFLLSRRNERLNGDATGAPKVSLRTGPLSDVNDGHWRRTRRYGCDPDDKFVAIHNELASRENLDKNVSKENGGPGRIL